MYIVSIFKDTFFQLSFSGAKVPDINFSVDFLAVFF